MAAKPTPVPDVLSEHEYLESAKLLVTPASHRLFFRIVIGTLIVGVLAMFLPWQQFVEGKGEVTAFAPSDRPQVVPSTIGGRIVEWFVQEGQVVTAGQPLLRIAEVKDDYLDPRTIDRYNERLQPLNLSTTEIAFAIPNNDRSTWVFIRVAQRSFEFAF